MNPYLLLSLSSFIFAMIFATFMFRKYYNKWWFFFFLFILFSAIWIAIYYLFFSGIDNPVTLTHISRYGYWSWIPCMYSFLFFIKNFQTLKWKILGWDTIAILVAYLGLMLLYRYTDLIIYWMAYDPGQMVYREIPGKLYYASYSFYVVFLALLVYFSACQIKVLNFLSRRRLIGIILATAVLIGSIIFLQLVLPIFDIWILEKQIILLYAGFVAYIYYLFRRYYFSSLGYGLGRIVVTVLAFLFSVIVLNVLKGLFLNGDPGTVTHYWNYRDQYSVLDTVIVLAVFTFSYRRLYESFIWKIKLNEFKNFRLLKQNLSQASDLKELNSCLVREMRRVFKTKFSEVRIFSSEGKSELQRYFENDLTERIFINDVVFVEENKSRFNKEALFGELPPEAFLVLPLFDREWEKNFGVLIVGVKPLGDFYTINEIDILQELVSFLELQMKYIKTYGQIRDLSVNLDKKVDEKTMEYNNLINRQKEFISVISHEIKSPIASAIFQADSILDEIDKGIAPDALKSEVSMLNDQLIRTGDLLAKLFSIQYFDTNHVTLFREKVQISRMLETEYEVYSRMHENIAFINKISPDMGFVEVDRIQFQQVITNLLGNAVKFLDKPNPTISLSAEKKDRKLEISIEDNGRWFSGIDTTKIFERYNTGWGHSIGLGMWLYLCKKIIDMHWWSIHAVNSKDLGGAKFYITIPVA